MSEEIKKLTDTMHVRLRTEMYLGSRTPHTQTVVNWTGSRLESQEVTWVPAIYNSFREIIDNSLDEVIGHGHGSRIDIIYNEYESTFVVTDDGRGIPIDWDENEKLHKVTMALTQLRTGRNFGDRFEVRGTNGIGCSATINCSSKSNVRVFRNNLKFTQSFEEPNELFREIQIATPKITKNTSGKTGTQIEFTLSSEVFKNLTLPTDFLRARIYEIAANHPDIKFYFNTVRVAVKPTLDKTLFSDTPFIKIPVENDQFNSIFYLVPNFCEEGEYVHSLVNDIPTFDGGHHVDVFKRNFFSNLIKALERESKKRNLTPNRSDISEGILIYNVTRMHAPNFDSQSKTRLINEEPEIYIRNALDDDKLYKTIIKNNQDWIDSIYKRCADRTQKKDEQEIARIGRKLMRSKVPKLLDATGKDRTKCIILITEGLSAVAQVSSVRNPEIHGALPLKGKILNVRGESPKVVIENQVIIDVMTSIGLTLGKKAIRKDLRYGQVYLAADQDPDGFNITALLVNFFYLHWPELFDPNQPVFFSAFQTPFIIQEKGKKRFYWYADDYHLYNPDEWKGCPKPTRAKGLGSLEEIDWTASLASPKLIPLVDDGGLSETLDMIFNHARADDRKLWISL
jgi:DNA gyrase/topoisomerase IV subunit B